MELNLVKIPLEKIRIDGGTQSRLRIDTGVVAGYAESIQDGAEFPPVIVFDDGVECWLADGFHRFHAHSQAGRDVILAEVHTGTVRDAILHSFGANGLHGLPRTNADKRKAVEALLADEEWCCWSQQKIARVCAVSAGFVSKLLAEIASLHGEEMRPQVRTVERAGKTYQQNTANIGKGGAAKPATPQGTPPKGPKADALRADLKVAQQRDEAQEQATQAHDQLAEARDTILQLAAENEALNDRLAVEAMDASEEEKTAAAETIAALREQVRVLEVELTAVKSSRDTYMRENAELKKQCAMQQRRLDKAEKAVA